MTAPLPEGMYDRFRLRMQEVESRNGIETILGYRRVTAEDLRQRGWVPAAEVERLTKERAENEARFAAVDGVLCLYLGREDDDQTQSLREYILRDRARLMAVLTALVDDSEGQQHRIAWQDACGVLHGHRGPEVGYQAGGATWARS